MCDVTARALRDVPRTVLSCMCVLCVFLSVLCIVCVLFVLCILCVVWDIVCCV